MIKLDIKKLILTCVLWILAAPAYADLKKDSSVLINSGKQLPKITTVGGTDSSMADAFSFDKKTVKGAKKTLRCWQDGVIIVAEQGWNLAAAQAPLLVNNKSQKAYAFNYSDTFCQYIGR